MGTAQAKLSETWLIRITESKLGLFVTDEAADPDDCLNNSSYHTSGMDIVVEETSRCHEAKFNVQKITDNSMDLLYKPKGDSEAYKAKFSRLSDEQLRSVLSKIGYGKEQVPSIFAEFAPKEGKVLVEIEDEDEDEERTVDPIQSPVDLDGSTPLKSALDGNRIQFIKETDKAMIQNGDFDLVLFFEKNKLVSSSGYTTGASKLYCKVEFSKYDDLEGLLKGLILPIDTVSETAFNDQRVSIYLDDFRYEYNEIICEKAGETAITLQEFRDTIGKYVQIID
jgi:hypothetical protein